MMARGDNDDPSSRCSADSERKYRFCHLPSNADISTRDVYSLLTVGRKLPPPVPAPPPGRCGPLTATTWFLHPTRVHPANGVTIC